ncbi:MAG: tRNA (N(6)-L-threonylcarbamoyladenosine(37)-C(2))-methylthiotransferase MtaB [Rhizobiales bacterium TMED168]|nr:MAG: tRNA (N(6)-L-threonylcarbamoyladenosine(37)-C(2))-methylthiotransferase MtaB [Rhizobiales bacterium TMED168]
MKRNAEIITFGCRLNIYESEILKQGVKDNNIENTSIFNSCAVTSETVRQVKQSIRKRKREFPGDKIIVTGCAAQTEPKTFSEMDEVDLVSGNIEKRNINNLISNEFSKNKINVGNIMDNKQELNGLTDGYDDRSRAFIEIQNGCNHRCTFCIIPYGRGNSSSKSVKDIISEINLMLETGHKEIVLTGVDIASWGHDLEKKSNLGFLISKILIGCPNLKRLKLSSMDIIGFDDQLLDIVSSEKRVLPHLHLSLQAGDNMILKRMKRRHLREDAINLCSKIRGKRKDVAFGADLITGFPTETNQMFLNTLKIVDECNLDCLHVFPFSPRPGTPAAKMPQNKREVSKERARILRNKGEEIKKLHLNNLVGKEVEVFVEKNNSGHTNQFAPVKLEDDFLPGSSVIAKIIKSDNNYVYGKSID